ncbi:MAG TPA: DoxX family protein [Terriglobales bacterium]|jgi:putative oxidoreductase
MQRVSDVTYFLLRLVMGFLFFCHGAQKILHWFGGAGQPVHGIALVSGWIELVVGLLVFFGIATRVAGFIGAGEMAVAYFMVHQSMGPLPIQNHGELAVIYCFVLLFIAAHGPRLWAIDSVIRTGPRRV